MLNIVLKPHTALFIGPTDCGKTQLLLDLLENEYRHHFEFIFIICSTIDINRSYLDKKWVWNDERIICVKPEEKLLKWLKLIQRDFGNRDILIIFDDIIADKNLDKRRSEIITLSSFGRHKHHSLWMVTQSYTAIPTHLRRQKKMVFCFRLDHKSDLKFLDEETNVIDDLEQVKKQLEQTEYSFLFINLKWPRGYKVFKNDS